MTSRTPERRAHRVIAGDPRIDPSTTMETIRQDPVEWEDFEAAANRTIEQHIHNSFIHTYKPVLDDADYRSFDTMEEYRQWCEDNLPDWLGYSRD